LYQGTTSVVPIKPKKENGLQTLLNAVFPKIF
jgi:hypothetical protein